MRYLVDTSALVRLYRRQVDSEWYDLADRGLIALCEPVLTETLLAVEEDKHYAAKEEELLGRYVSVWEPDGLWRLSAKIRRKLAENHAHQGVSVADLMVAATAIRLKLEVLHEDRDFETYARYMPELKQRRISLGVGE